PRVSAVQQWRPAERFQTLVDLRGDLLRRRLRRIGNVLDGFDALTCRHRSLSRVETRDLAVVLLRAVLQTPLAVEHGADRRTSRRLRLEEQFTLAGDRGHHRPRESHRSEERRGGKGSTTRRRAPWPTETQRLQ